MTKQNEIDHLRKEASNLCKIPEIEDREYKMIFYRRENNSTKKNYSKLYKSVRKML